MRIIALLAFALVFSPTPIVLAAPSLTEQIKTMCSEKWGTEYSMVKYCIDKEVSAARYVSKIQGDVPKEILGPCFKKWGIEMSMVKYCIEMSMVKYCIDKEAGALSDLGRIKESFDPEIMERCRAK